MVRGWGITTASVALLIAGCSSSLDEYRCQGHQQCTSDSEGPGLCHESGYCTYLDIDSCNGYRFGQHSGVQSNECVPQENLPDAGVPDAFLPAPVASIAVPILGCDETIVSIDATASEAFEGAELTSYTWTLFGPMGEVLRTLQGAPGLAFPRGSNFVSGSVDNLVVNLTAYMDSHAIYSRSGGTPNRLSLDELPLTAGDYALFFSAGDNNVMPGELLDVKVHDDDQTGGTYVDTQVPVLEGLATHRIEFTVPVDTVDGEIIFLHDRDDVWLDNIGLVQIPATNPANPIVANRSFEASRAPWQSSTGPGGALTRNKLQAALMAYGEYSLELVVTDSNGKQSLPQTINLDHQACN